MQGSLAIFEQDCVAFLKVVQPGGEDLQLTLSLCRRTTEAFILIRGEEDIGLKVEVENRSPGIEIRSLHTLYWSCQTGHDLAEIPDFLTERCLLLTMQSVQTRQAVLKDVEELVVVPQRHFNADKLRIARGSCTRESDRAWGVRAAMPTLRVFRRLWLQFHRSYRSSECATRSN